MKSLKKVMAALLAAVIVITGGAFAFAANAETVIEWEYNEEYVFEALYAGEATEGTFTVKEMDEYESVYYTFNAEKAGYYTITFDWYPVDYCLVAETYEDGKATGDREYLFSEDGDNYVNMYYFDEGVNYICFDLYENDSYDSYAEIEFVGEKITNVIFDEEEIDTLLIDAEIYEYEYEEGFIWWTEAEIVFDTGKTLSYDDIELVFDMKNPLEKGEVELTLNVFDYSKDYVVTAYEITDVITDARVVEESSKEVEILYDGTINDEKLDGMTLEITFSNGEKVTAPIEYTGAGIEFPNGKTFWFEVYYSSEAEDEIYINVTFPYNGETFLHEKCEKTEASKEANKETLKENISYPFEISSLIFAWDLSELEYAGTIGGIISVIFGAFGDAAANYEWAFSNMFTELMAYIAYALSI